MVANTSGNDAFLHYVIYQGGAAMFFSKTRDPLPLLVSVLSEYFQVSATLSERWCKSAAGVLTVTLPFVAASQHAAVQRAFTRACEKAKVAVPPMTIASAVASYTTALPAVTNIRNIIAVASGKGGVGKSATSINLALALQAEGASVGLLDADIYGPSVPIMLGQVTAQPASSDGKHMQPVSAWGIASNSIGYLVPAEDAAVWRGPMASRALKQLIDETLWPVLDYLIVDMPPGTGDIQLTMAQQVPLTAAVIVTTPQDLALADAQKGISMFSKVKVPVAGLIENMSYFQCSACGHKSYVFSQGGGSKLAERYQLPLLGQVPLDERIREAADEGMPLLVHQPDSDLADIYRQAARTLSRQLALTLAARDHQKHVRGTPIDINTRTS